jgi:hypothetical protein
MPNPPHLKLIRPAADFTVDCLVVWYPGVADPGESSPGLLTEAAQITAPRAVSPTSRARITFPSRPGSFSHQALLQLALRINYVLAPVPGEEPETSGERKRKMIAFSHARRAGFNCFFHDPGPMDILPHYCDNRVLLTPGWPDEIGVRVRVVWVNLPFLAENGPQTESREGYLYWYDCRPHGVSVVRFLPDKEPRPMPELSHMGGGRPFFIVPSTDNMNNPLMELKFYYLVFAKALKSGAPVALEDLATEEDPTNWPDSSKKPLLPFDKRFETRVAADGEYPPPEEGPGGNPPDDGQPLPF